MKTRNPVPYGKMSKKAKRALDARKRRDWGGLNPVTRKPENPRAYNRSKMKARGSDDGQNCVFCFKMTAPRFTLCR